MIASWHIGDIRVTSILEYIGPTHDPAQLYPDFDRSAFELVLPGLPAGHYYRGMDRLVVAIQTWLVEAGDRRILIDTGVGNAKDRPVARMDRLNTLWLDWLAAAGQSVDSITDVVMTHLHPDHVGWNTRWDGERWVPTFPNATYHIPREDFDWLSAARRDGSFNDIGSWDDSILPVLDAGQASFVTGETPIAEHLSVTRAPGHTPGMLNFWISSGDQQAVFCGDIFHTIVQVLCPGWNTAFCEQTENAIATRHEFLRKASQTGALVMPCHFAPPFCGYIREDRDGYRFEPANPGSVQ